VAPIRYQGIEGPRAIVTGANQALTDGREADDKRYP
jgi:hypothetical protein